MSRVDPAPWQVVVDRLADLGPVSVAHEPQDDAPRWRLQHRDPTRPTLVDADPWAEVERHAREVVAGRTVLQSRFWTGTRTVALGSPSAEAGRGARRHRGPVPGWG